jgi:hypothetical protein
MGREKEKGEDKCEGKVKERRGTVRRVSRKGRGKKTRPRVGYWGRGGGERGR